jgi:fumarylacetoacetase
MTYKLNETHDAKITSWVQSANQPGCDFPVQNLPFGLFRERGTTEAPRVGVAIGNQVLDIGGVESQGFFEGPPHPAGLACLAESLNELMELGPEQWSALRLRLHQLLRSDAPEGYKQRIQRYLSPIALADMLVPAHIGDYTDFYASIFHATNVGGMFRPDNPLLPNYKYVPIGYHGRASSIVPSGSEVRRPKGQTRDDAARPPQFGPSKRLDYELEVGFYVGAGNKLGEPIPIEQAEQHIFGLCLVNDWSARDIQTWEYQPLGPFLAKNFATTVSPWVVTMEALAPYRAQAFVRPEGDPAPLPYLSGEEDRRIGAVDLMLEVSLSTRKMREAKTPPARLSVGNFRDMYWTIAQLLTHHASNGCNMRAGDLLASGTVSGPTKESRGSMLELSWKGTEPIQLPSGEVRKFLEDGDEVIIRGWCEREGAVRIGFGECRGIIVGA